jgi:hypothetical protein
MFGLPDYLIRVATAGLEGFESFLATRLGELPGVDKLDSHITIKLIKAPEQRADPVGSDAPGRRRGTLGRSVRLRTSAVNRVRVGPPGKGCVDERASGAHLPSSDR